MTYGIVRFFFLITSIEHRYIGGYKLLVNRIVVWVAAMTSNIAGRVTMYSDVIRKQLLFLIGSSRWPAVNIYHLSSQRWRFHTLIKMAKHWTGCLKRNEPISTLPNFAETFNLINNLCVSLLWSLTFSDFI